MKGLIKKATVAMMFVFPVMFAVNAWALEVTTYEDFMDHKDDPNDVIYLKTDIALQEDTETTCALYILPGYKITLTNLGVHYRLTESGPHLSTGSYQQYVLYQPDLTAEKAVIYTKGAGTSEVLVSWFGHNHVAAKAALWATKDWTDGRIIRFTEGEEYVFDNGGLTTENDTNATHIIATGAIFTGTYHATPWFQFRGTGQYTEDGSKLWVWEGGYFKYTLIAAEQHDPGYVAGSTCFKFISTRGFEIRNARIEDFDNGMNLDNTDSVNIHDNMIFGCNRSIQVPDSEHDTQSLSIVHNMISTPAPNYSCLTYPACNPLREIGIAINSRAEKLRINDNTFDGLWTESVIRIYDQSHWKLEHSAYTTPMQAPEITGNHIEGWAGYCDTSTGFGCVNKYAMLLLYQPGWTNQPTSTAGFAAVSIERNNISTTNSTGGFSCVNNDPCATDLYLQGTHNGTIDNNQFYNGPAGNPMYAIETDADANGLMVGGGNHYENHRVLKAGSSNVPISAARLLDKNNATKTSDGYGSQTLQSTTVKGGTLGNGLRLRVVASGTKGGAYSTHRIRFIFGTKIINAPSTTTTTPWRFEAEVDNTSTGAQKITWVYYDGTNTESAAGFDTATEDTESDVIVKMNAYLADQCTATQETWRVEVQ